MLMINAWLWLQLVLFDQCFPLEGFSRQHYHRLISVVNVSVVQLVIPLVTARRSLDTRTVKHIALARLNVTFYPHGYGETIRELRFGFLVLRCMRHSRYIGEHYKVTKASLVYSRVSCYVWGASKATTRQAHIGWHARNVSRTKAPTIFLNNIQDPMKRYSSRIPRGIPTRYRGTPGASHQPSPFGQRCVPFTWHFFNITFFLFFLLSIILIDVIHSRWITNWIFRAQRWFPTGTIIVGLLLFFRFFMIHRAECKLKYHLKGLRLVKKPKNRSAIFFKHLKMTILWPSFDQFFYNPFIHALPITSF